jgi:FAD-dependent oxidoreductase domain-containing protein 1
MLELACSIYTHTLIIISSCSVAGSKIVHLSPSELKERFPWISTDGIAAATLGVQNEGWFDPWSYLVALKKKSIALGVDFIQGEVKGFDFGNEGIENVHVDQKETGGIVSLNAKNVVNAAGPWASKIVEACGIYDFPVRPR